MNVGQVIGAVFLAFFTACASRGASAPDIPGDGETGPGGVRTPTGLDEFGGVLDLPIAGEGARFALVEDDRRWWLRTPGGHAFLGLAVARIAFDGEADPERGFAPFERANRAWYGDDEAGRLAFYQEAFARIARVGFNTLGSGSHEAARLVARRRVSPVPYVVSVAFFAPGLPSVNGDGFPDVFDSGFAAHCEAAVREAVTEEQRVDPFLIGVFADAGVRWWGEGRGGPTPGASLADSFIALPPGTPGKDAFVQFVFDALGYTPTTLGAAWGRSLSSRDDVAALQTLADDPAHPAIARDKAAFVGHVARAYFGAVEHAIRSLVPGALFLCAPFDGSAPEEVLRAAEVCDVVSIREGNPLDDEGSVAQFGEAVTERWRHVAREAGHGVARPLWLIVPGVHARDSGFPEPGGHGAVVGTQADRGRWVREVLGRALAAEEGGKGLVVGVEVGTFADAPGRNTGLVAVHGSPYLTYESGVQAAVVLAWDRLLGGTAPVLDVPQNLRVEAGLPVRLSWDPVLGATAYEVLLAQDPAFLGVVARAEWGGATVDGPEDLRWVVGANETAVERPLSAGPWYASVSARADTVAVASDFSPPVEFTALRSCPEAHGTEAGVGCLERSVPEKGAPGAMVTVSTLYFDALGVVVPDAVFVLPGGADDPDTEALLVREYPKPVEGSAASDRFCPAPVIASDGQRTNAARFIRVRHVTPFGQVVVDRTLDPDGGVAPFSCAGPVPSMGVPIARKVYSLDLSNPLLPRDQRIEVQLH